MIDVDQLGVDELRALVREMRQRESDLIHVAWNEGRKAQRPHHTEDFERIFERVAKMKAAS